MTRVVYSTLYTEGMTDEERQVWQAGRDRFLAVARETGATAIESEPEVSAEAEGDAFARLLMRLNDAHVPYALPDQEQRASDDSMPA